MRVISTSFLGASVLAAVLLTPIGLAQTTTKVPSKPVTKAPTKVQSKAPSKTAAPNQTWEKLVAPGLVYRMEVDFKTPLVIHALRYTPGVNVSARAETAKELMFNPAEEAKGRDIVSKTMERTGAIAGINGDFFPWTGDPLGAMVRNSELISRPFPNRGAFAWGSGFTAVSALAWDAKLTTELNEQLKIDGLNEECGENAIVLNTRTAGWAISKQLATHVVLSVHQALRPKSSFGAKVLKIVKDVKELEIHPGEFVVTGTGLAALKLGLLQAGKEVVITTSMEGFDWDKTKNVIGGGPVLVIAGSKSVSAEVEGFKADFSDARHPRTAIGATREGDVWLVVVEGRQSMSRGVTLDELADIMLRLGCVKAINLDGGGSSTLAAAGIVLNRPSDGQERPVANGVYLFGSLMTGAVETEMVIQGLPHPKVGQPTTFTVIGSNGDKIPNSQVLWSAMGAGWIDQSGILRGIKGGKATIRASVHGKVVSIQVTVEDPNPKATKPAATSPKTQGPVIGGGSVKVL